MCVGLYVVCKYGVARVSFYVFVLCVWCVCVCVCGCVHLCESKVVGMSCGI